MRRLGREQLRTNIWVALSVLKPYEKRALGLNIERIREAVADDLVRRIMGSPDSETVILQPDMAGPAHAPWLGRWGIDEPHPHPDLEPR
ncbi:hypothetical protein SFC76_02900 [Sphingomonas sp. CD22]|uniref:hypothetical protein n=1 Tax=Sphingomonas sp. CD22 TaxID=3100214 RepID=UPI002AE0773C|nr:hypothetical protein [Sphingomonas sp. CD22]MEA1083196.1 hypothetical protein [Sphingomonas sp. CD22]